MRSGNIYLDYVDAKNGLLRANERVVVSHGVGSVIAKVSLRVAEARFHREEDRYWQDSPVEPPALGNATEIAIESGPTGLRDTQNDDITEDLNTPTQSIDPKSQTPKPPSSQES